tara:strand:+ start:958 stop:1134 length:177 start_codon:yes stop_codon:yes gene_type:complete
MKFNMRMLTCIIGGMIIGVIIGSLTGKVYIGTIIGITIAGVLCLTLGQKNSKTKGNTD